METYKQFFQTYSALYRPYVNQLNNELAEFQLYSSQWRILLFIWNHGKKNVSEITEYQRVEKPTTTKMLQRLIELNYLETTAGEDKRTKVVQLTDSGSKVCEAVQEKINQFHYYLLKDTEEQDQIIATKVLQSISNRVFNYENNKE